MVVSEAQRCRTEFLKTAKLFFPEPGSHRHSLEPVVISTGGSLRRSINATVS